MKLLFDQNLSRKLVNRLADIFPGASHIQSHKLAEKTDSEIWEFARKNDFCIVTQDADFTERSRLYGSPPKVVWLRWFLAPIARVIIKLQQMELLDLFMTVKNDKARGQLGWTPRYNSYRQGLEQTLQTWHANDVVSTRV